MRLARSVRVGLAAGALVASLTSCGRTDLEAWLASDASAPIVRDATRSVDGDAQPVAKCVPGEQIACVCPSGTPGVTICVDGGYGACRGCSDASRGDAAACTPGTKDCTGQTPELCDSSGAWRPLAPCTGTTPLCIEGACVPCSPGTVQCLGDTPQICDDDGAWQSQAPCSLPTPDCSLGACTCVHAQCAGTCTDLATDPSNCGACGHDCLGGGCADGACLPVLVTSYSGYPVQVASDGTSVYWTDFTGVAKALISTGVVTRLSTSNTDGFPDGFVVTGGYVYWSSDDGVFRIGTAGGSAVTLVNADNGGVAADDTGVYWGGQVESGLNIQGTVVASRFDGGATATLVTLSENQFVEALATDGTSVFFETTSTDAGAQLWSVPRGGGTAQPLTTLPVIAGAHAAAAGEVYWAEQDPRLIFPINSTINAVAPGGGTPVTLANGQTEVGPIVTDGTIVVWANSCGEPQACSEVLSLPEGSLEVSVLAASQYTVNGVAVDPLRAFWTSYDGNSGSGFVYWVAR